MGADAMFTTLKGLTDRGPTDALVIGSGPAGLTVATALRTGGARVVLLESGSRRAVQDTLNDVTVTGLPFSGSRSGRARGFGGTGQKWAGQCLPLDNIDLTPRSWVAGSGWPLGAEELAPWVVHASRLFGLPDATYRERDADSSPVRLPDVDPGRLQWRVTNYSPGRRLGSRLRATCHRDRDLTVVLDATVVRLVVSGTRVTGAVTRSHDGQERTLSAGAVVLACGGLENARVLLASGEASQELGNTSGHVGRGLQDHPYWLVGTVVGSPPELGQVFQSMLAGKRRIRPRLTLAPEQQRGRSTLNCVADLELDHGPRSAVGALKRVYDAVKEMRRPPGLLSETVRMLAEPRTLTRELAHRARGVGSPPDRHTRLLLRLQTEQPPLGKSHVRLSERRDALGCRGLEVYWTVGEQEQRTCVEMADVVAGQLRDLGLGRLELFPWLDDPALFRRAARDFFHHSGTTRMALDPAHGVVDPDCRVHGVDNLYVLGSSIFPSSGYAHPTLTIVALALRLADHLRRAL